MQNEAKHKMENGKILKNTKITKKHKQIKREINNK